MSESPSPCAPGPGDYIVVHHPQRPDGQQALALIHLTDNAAEKLVRATLESDEETCQRFEDEARLLAAASSTRGFRCVNGVYSPLDDAVDDHDA